MLFKKTLLTLMALFMSASGMPVYAEEAPAPEVTETDKKLVPETGTASVLGIKKLYAEENIASGTWGTCSWTIDANGVLTIGAGTGEDVKSNYPVPTNIGWYDYREQITSVVANQEIVLPNNVIGLFSGMSNAAKMDLSGVNATGTTILDYMFYNCSNVNEIDISSWGNINPYSTEYMFAGCSSLKSLDLTNIGWASGPDGSTSHIIDGCTNLSAITPGHALYYGSDPFAEHTEGTGNWAMDDPYNHSQTLTPEQFNNLLDDMFWESWIPDDWAMHTWYWELPGANLKFLPNSTYVLSGTSDYGTPINMVVTSNKNGRMSLKNIEKGTYTLTEVFPTDGYIKNSVKYTVTVTDSGVSVTPDNADYYYETADQKVLFNEPYHAFTIQKASSTDSTIGVAGAEFLLSGVSDYGTEVSQTQTTGSTGIATFDHLEAGNYLLTETKAPEHYALDPISRVVSINKYGTVKIDGLPKEGSSFVWTDIRNADGTVTITKKWNDTLTGTNAAGRALPSIVISTQRTIPDAVTVTYYAGEGYFGTDKNNKTNVVKYSEAVDQNGNALSVAVSKGEEKTPSASGKTFDAWYLDSALTIKAPNAIADYIKANPKVQTIGLYAKYKDTPTLTTGEKFNEAIKTLAAGKNTHRYDDDTLIKSIQVVNTRPSDSTPTKDVSANQDGSYLAWWDAGTHTIKLYSESGDVILNPDSSDMFYYCSSLTTLDASNWDTSQVTNMSSMLRGCSKLTTLDVSNWNTGKVTGMNSMFFWCSSLTTLDLSTWNTSQVTDMNSMFAYCSKLTALDVSKWDTSQVTNMRSMFQSCNKLTNLDLSNWDTGQVTNMNSMFYGCSHLATLDVSGWDTIHVTNMGYMFYTCSSLTTIYIGSNWNTDRVTSSGNLFRNCTKLPHFNSKSVDKTHANAGPGGYMTLKS